MLQFIAIDHVARATCNGVLREACWSTTTWTGKTPRISLIGAICGETVSPADKVHIRM